LNLEAIVEVLLTLQTEWAGCVTS